MARKKRSGEAASASKSKTRVGDDIAAEDLTSAVDPRVPVGTPRWTPPVPPVRRASLIPTWLPVSAISLVVVIVATAGIISWRSRSALVDVPDLTGLDPAIAAQQLEAIGVDLIQGDRRFSATVPSGYIVDQAPAAGTEIAEGSAVTVAVSAGSERLPMPDVVGKRLDIARGQLKDRGLNVIVEALPSEQPSGTVLLSYPSPGVTIATGDTVRLSVASADTTGGLLLPTDMRGMSFVIDPSPMPVANATADPAMDVARRLRSLLEASGATVVVTREVADGMGGVSVDQRIQRARAATQT
ncbi:MAG TPA: PASTA domain-containing protein, partial [Coriobacteriia bacterium]